MIFYRIVRGCEQGRSRLEKIMVFIEGLILYHPKIYNEQAKGNALDRFVIKRFVKVMLLIPGV